MGKLLYFPIPPHEHFTDYIEAQRIARGNLDKPPELKHLIAFQVHIEQRELIIQSLTDKLSALLGIEVPRV